MPNFNFKQQEFTYSLSNFFTNKGYLASVAEKAVNNFRSKKKTRNDLYYFAVAHTFKQIEKAEVFKGCINSATQEMEYVDFHSLRPDEFSKVKDDLEKLLVNIRHHACHYIREMDDLKTDNLGEPIIKYIKESFRLALVQSFINECLGKHRELQEWTKEEKRNEIGKLLKDESDIIFFAKRLFYPALYTSNQKEENHIEEDTIKKRAEKKAYIDEQWNTLDNAIDYILFVTNDTEDFKWVIKGDSFHTGHKEAYQHPVLPLSSGKYLSFHACIFLMSTFLYKNEGRYLIPKIPGFKRQNTPEYRSKLNVFLFFAKKFSSQDIDSNEKHLVYFRDIIQYLNKYPVAWNSKIEQKDTGPLRPGLIAKIHSWEIERNYPLMNEDSSFKDYAAKYFFDTEQIANHQPSKYRALIEQEQTIQEVYLELSTFKNDMQHWRDGAAEKKYRKDRYEYFVRKYILDQQFVQSPLKARLIQYRISEKKYREFMAKFQSNTAIEKLKRRIDRNLLYPSYSRNDDNFLAISIRYLAEENYFGAEACFKMTKYQTSDEQAEAHSKLSPEELDKIPFKGSKETCYRTYAESLVLYPTRDSPFIVENNAVFVKLNGSARPVCIQKDLMIYLLEHALFISETHRLKGKHLISKYLSELDKAKKQVIDQLATVSYITREDKNTFKKLLPRRLLQHYCPSEYNGHSTMKKGAGLTDILENANQSEERYERLLEEARSNKNIDEYLAATTNRNGNNNLSPEELANRRVAFFQERNKGKNFKLTFIRKACHILYFRESYERNVDRHGGHHKQFHITRTEFNNFCKWMYAFDTVPDYKLFLKKLFEQKGFYNNQQFKELFENAASLDEFYTSVKLNYAEWLNRQTFAEQSTANLSNYKQILEHGVRYINVQHFKKFLLEEGIFSSENGKFTYPSLQNKEYLVQAYYPTWEEKGKVRRFCYELTKVKHEDCLLFEIALHYFNPNKKLPGSIKSNVRSILIADIPFSQLESNGEPYQIMVPHKDVEKLRQLQSFEKSKPQYAQILLHLPAYLSINKKEKALKAIAKSFEIDRKINLSDIGKINNHIINQQSRFTQVILVLEEYYIWKHHMLIENTDKRIKLADIPELGSFMEASAGKAVRNDAFHFNLPLDESYEQVFEKIEKWFKKIEINTSNYAELNRMQLKVLEIFITKMRNDLYDKKQQYIKQNERTRKVEHQRVIREVISEYVRRR